MNPKQLRYAVELAEIRNFSKVSEKLNITQPALSKQIILLEKELGVKLFNRDSVPLELTPAGEHFISGAKELIYKEEQLARSMEGFREGQRGRLKIGVSPFRSQYLIPPVVKKIREKYPNVEVCVSDTNSEQIRKDVADGKLDFAIVNLPIDDTVFEYVSLEQDVLVLVVPNELLRLIDNAPTDNLAEIDFSACERVPFVVTEKSKEMRVLFDKLCVVAEIHPDITMEVVGIATAWSMAQAGIGATLVPLQFINNNGIKNEKMTLFKVKENMYHRQPVIITRRGQYVSEYAKYAMQILKGND